MREHSTKIKVLKFCISQIGVPSISLLSLIDRLVRSQFLATILRLSSVISSQPTINNVFINKLLAKIGYNFF